MSHPESVADQSHLHLTTLVVAVLLAAGLYGCGGQNFESAPPAPAPAPIVTAPAHEGGHVTMASWYGPGFVGHTTSSGERFNDHAMTAASKTLPLGSHVKVTNLSNGKSVVVRINDRGPYVRGRGIDLSRGAADKIGLRHKGVGAVKISRIDGPSGEVGDSMPGEVTEPRPVYHRWRRRRYARSHRSRRHYAATRHYFTPSTPAKVEKAEMVPNPVGDWLMGAFR